LLSCERMPLQRLRFTPEYARRRTRANAHDRRRRARGGWLARMARFTLVVALLPVAPIVALRFVDPPLTAFMLARAATTPPCPPLALEWKQLALLPEHVGWSAIAAEDQRFYQHAGFDLNAIRAALRDRSDGRQLRGASTLSQQVTKNLFLWPDRSWIRKALEGYLTLWLEIVWPKERILEVYLNVAQFGPCTFGIGAASQHYFGRSATELTRDQAARLMTTLPNPSVRRPIGMTPFQDQRARQIRGQARTLARQYERTSHTNQAEHSR